MVKLGSGTSASLPMADPGFSREKLTAATSFEDTVHLPLVVIQMVLNIIAILWNHVNVHESTKTLRYLLEWLSKTTYQKPRSVLSLQNVEMMNVKR